MPDRVPEDSSVQVSWPGIAPAALLTHLSWPGYGST